MRSGKVGFSSRLRVRNSLIWRDDMDKENVIEKIDAVRNRPGLQTTAKKKIGEVVGRGEIMVSESCLKRLSSSPQRNLF